MLPVPEAPDALRPLLFPHRPEASSARPCLEPRCVPALVLTGGLPVRGWSPTANLLSFQRGGLLFAFLPSGPRIVALQVGYPIRGGGTRTSLSAGALGLYQDPAWPLQSVRPLAPGGFCRFLSAWERPVCGGAEVSVFSYGVFCFPPAPSAELTPATAS